MLQLLHYICFCRDRSEMRSPEKQGNCEAAGYYFLINKLTYEEKGPCLKIPVNEMTTVLV